MNTPNFKKINSVTALVCTLALIITSASIISKVVWQVLDKETSFPVNKVLSNTLKTLPSSPLPTDLFGALNSEEEPKNIWTSTPLENL